MAHLKLVAAMVVALSAIVLEPAAGKGVWIISNELRSDMSKNLTSEDLTNAETVFSFAKQYLEGLEWFFEKENARKLLAAWDRVLHHPDQCDELSFGYLDTIWKCRPHRYESFDTLTEATKVYASNCVSAEFITKMIKQSQDSVNFLERLSQPKEVQFIDDQLIADYWSDHPGDKDYTSIGGLESSKAIARAIIRDRGYHTKYLKESDQVKDYLAGRLSDPCYWYWKASSPVLQQTFSASQFLEGGFDKLISSLDDKTQKLFFRHRLCRSEETWYETSRISDKVLADLKSLANY